MSNFTIVSAPIVLRGTNQEMRHECGSRGCSGTYRAIDGKVIHFWNKLHEYRSFCNYHCLLETLPAPYMVQA